jgi:hypothetical protein
MNFSWHENGFAAPPALVLSTGTERLYRAWGGHPSHKWGNNDRSGVCFSLDRAFSRWHAEQLFAVMEYQNPVRHLSEFSVPGRLPLWVGRVHPGDFRAVLGKVSGSQVFIERAYLHLLTEVATTDLLDDLGKYYVFAGRRPRVDS